jgi:NAD+ synthase
VCGTSNRTEYLLGYCTKYGDNAADVQPIVHLNKTDIWKIAKNLGVPEKIINRTPTAGLWPDQTDEEELGMTYKDIDTAIKNLEENSWIPENHTEKKILEKMQRAGHKKQPAPHL